MEYIDGISVKNIEFRPNVCKQIYKIDKNLKKNLLNHNDIKSRNIIVTENHDIVIIDYGESCYSI
jgi:tRNA A-37 threonylcarbamoyl transferase component Bud32